VIEPGVGSIRIRADALSAIRAHARRESPNECCGLLAGTAGLIDEAVPAANLLSSPYRFQLDPVVHVAINRRLRGTPRAVVGVYHSHPRAAAVPSPRDLAEAHYPEFIWLIVSLQTPDEECRAWRIVDGRARELTIVISNRR
jgi:proteasome lid subunit RPN8/RPN11